MLPEDTHFYFAHSYFVQAAEESDVLAATEYDVRFASAVGRENLLGTQFHPEKSGPAGLDILKRFVALAREGTPCWPNA